MFQNLLFSINEQILNPLIFLLMALASLQFIWGLLVYVKDSDNDEVRENGKRHMIYGVIGLAIMISVFGIIYFIADTIGVAAPSL